MPTVVVKNRRTTSLEWNPRTSAGFPASSSRMVAITSGATYVYAFPYEPKNIQFSSVSAEYVTVERPGLYPLIEWKGPQLTQVSFNFLVINRTSRGLLPVENDLDFLSFFTTLNAPITFSGTGQIMTSIQQHGTSSAAGFRAWRISDFSFNTRDKNIDGHVTQAEASITLIEDRNPSVATALIPRISYTEYVPTTAAKTTKPADPWEQLKGYAAYITDIAAGAYFGMPG